MGRNKKKDFYPIKKVRRRKIYFFRTRFKLFLKITWNPGELLGKALELGTRRGDYNL